VVEWVAERKVTKMTERLTINMRAMLTVVEAMPGLLPGVAGRECGLTLNAAVRAVEALERRYLVVRGDDGAVYATRGR
jgi:hypothetical protein